MPFFAGPALRLGIYLSLFDVHVQRAPVAGKVTRCEHRPGRHVRFAYTTTMERLAEGVARLRRHLGRTWRAG